MNNNRFLSAYNRLDNYLQSLVSTSGHVNMIYFLEKISPEKQKSELKTIREYKNVIESHGVNPGEKKPVVPEEWINWLLRELDWCKKNADIIAPKLQKALNSSQKNRRITNTVGVIDKQRTPALEPVKHQKQSGYVIYIVSSSGTGRYFVGFELNSYRTGFLKLKKEYYRTINKTSIIQDAKIYPTREAAEFVAAKVRKEASRCHISVIRASF